MSNKASDQLFNLIKSLTTPEKRYFKVYSSRHATIGSKGVYLKLFEAINKQSEYDEEAILKKFKGQAIINRFSISKNRLYHSILRALDSYYYDSSVDADLRRLLHSVEILYKKSLYDQAFKLMNSAKRIAYEHQKHTILIEILNWEKMLIEKDNYEGVSQESIDEILKEDKRIASLIDAYNEFWNVKSHLFHLLFRKGKARSEEEIQQFKSLMDHTLLHRTDDEISVHTRYLYYHIYSAYYFGTGDYEQCYSFLTKNIAFIEDNNVLFQEEPNTYVSVLTNAIYVGMQLKRYEEAFAYLEKLRNVPEKLVIPQNENLEIRLFSSATSIELALYALTGEFEKGLDIIHEVENGLVRFYDKLSSVRKAAFYFSIAIIYYGAGDLSQAQYWINELLNTINVDESEDIHCFAQIMNLIIQLDRGKNKLVPYALKSTSRYLQSRNRVYRFESVVLNFIRRSLKARSIEDRERIYEDLVTSLKELRADPFESTAFEYFDFVSWAESKLYNRPFKELVKEKARVGA